MNIVTKQSKPSSKGFTLIELMVTVSVLVLVTGVILSRNSSFNDSVLLKSQAYQIALDIRQAQAYGVSASAQTGDVRSPFGIYFDQTTPGQYLLFQDVNANGYSSGEIVGQPYLLDSRFVISEICVPDGDECDSQDSTSVEFKRPNFDALIFDESNTKTTDIEIHVSPVGSSNVVRKVVISNAGLITIE